MKTRISIGWLVVLSLMPILGSAQVYLRAEQRLSDSLSYRQNFDHFIKNLDKSKFGTGVLYDRVYPFARLHRFAPDAPKDTSSYEHFIQAYYELYLASYDNSKLKTFQEVKRSTSEATAKGQIPLGIISYEFNYLDSTAIQDNALVVQGNQLRLSGNSNRTYVKRGEAFVASLLASTIKSGSNTFTLDAAFIYCNTKQSIDRVEVDFGNASGVLTLIPGQVKSFNVTGSGKLGLGYSLYLKNGKKLSGYSSVEVTPVKTIMAAALVINSCDSIRIESDKLYMDLLNVNRKGVADMMIYYSSCSNKQLVKPMIIFDGFDPGDTRKGNDIYKLINKDFYLADKLRAKGFDIVIVNFPLGADFIVRNAYAAETVIKWVNQNKITNNKLVVIGPSMGGLISRYALADLEKEGYNHQVGLWVSFDSPHQGANIAMGDQYFLDFFGRVANNAGAQAGLDKLNSPAALQMLVDHYSKPSNIETPQCSWYRNSFVNELTSNGLAGSNGYPLNLRKIALLNGSGIGTKQEGIDNTQYLLEMNLWKNLLLVKVRVAHGEVATSADLSSVRRSVFYGFCADASNLGYYWEKQNWSRPSTSQYFTTSYDKAPGGSTNTQNTLAEGGSGFTVYYPGHCFIPTVSALDLKTPYLGMNISTANIIANKLTPFDSYYAPVENQAHITFSAASVNWIETELGTNWEISGPEIICPKKTVFTAINIPSGYSISWNKSPNLNLTPIPNSYNANVSPNGSGSGWIEAQIPTKWGSNVTITKNIQIGSLPSISSQTPLAYFDGSTYNNVCNGQNYSTSMVISNASNFNWSRIAANPSNTSWYQSGNNISFYFWSVNQTAVFRISASNGCGTTSYDFGFKSINCGGGGGGGCNAVYAVSPNPSKGKVKIIPQIPAPCLATTTTSNKSGFVSLYDQQGTMKKKIKYNYNSEAEIDVSDLKNGLYIIEISDGISTDKQTIIVQH